MGETPVLETLLQTLSEALGLHRGHRAWKQNARAAERIVLLWRSSEERKQGGTDGQAEDDK